MAKIKKIKNGNYQVRYRDLMKEQRARNFKTSREAKAFLVHLEYELKNGAYVDDRKGETPFEEVWKLFISLKAAKKENTKADYTSLWKVHLGPKWGRMPIRSISRNKFDSWIISLGLSPRRTDKLHLVACMIFDVAVEEELLHRNPLKDVIGHRVKTNLPKVPNRQVGHAISLEDLVSVARHAGKYEDYILFLGLTGARWGEFVALRVRDLNLKNGVVAINKSIAEINGRLVPSETTKTHQDREVQLPDFLLDRAESWISGKDPDDYLFASPTGCVLRNNNFARRIYKPALKASGIDPIRLHDLRWSAISIAASIGTDQQVVRIQVGHSNAHMTNAYTQIFKVDQSKAVERLNKAVSEVHKKCTNDEMPLTARSSTKPKYAQKGVVFGLQTLDKFVRQQNYESGALTN